MNNWVIKWRASQCASLALLMLVTAVLLGLGLGHRELWGAETRWANIALQMLQSHDYFDPYLKGSAYYDKPLPSYWIITLTAWLTGGLDHWSLRLPSVISAWFSVWLIYALGKQLYGSRVGLLAGWLLTTTFYFLFWARVATADLLTVCGVLAAVWWYWREPDSTRLSRYSVFFVILALTSLLKGLIGFVIPGLLLLPHLVAQGRLRRHMNLRLVAGLTLAVVLYALPFLLSHRYAEPNYAQSGLGLVFRENVVRFFRPFDNFGPIYTYLIYLPVYTLPWAPCWIAGGWQAIRQWRHLEPNVRWLVWGLGLLFVFFTASGSRRSYYVLPLVPFAQLLGAWWLQGYLTTRRRLLRPVEKYWVRAIAAATIVLLVIMGAVYPLSSGSVQDFARQVRQTAGETAPWPQWRLVMIDVDNRLPMYLQQVGGVPFYYVPEGVEVPRDGTPEQFWSWLEQLSGQHWDPAHTLVLTQFQDRQQLPLSYLQSERQTVLSGPSLGARWARSEKGGSLAYLPRLVNPPDTLGQ